MAVTLAGHRIDGARFEETAKCGGAWLGARFIVMHYTANGSLEATVRTFRRRNASAHLIVGHDGETVQMVPFDQRAWHAGRSSATSKWGKKYSGLNECAIGIEMVNYGYLASHVPASIDAGDWPKARHRNGGPVRRWQPYPAEQTARAEALCRALMAHYAIPPEHVLGHDEISPDRKVDPGPLFDMNDFRRSLKGKTNGT